MNKSIATTFLVVIFCLGLYAPVLAQEEASCPWKISKIKVGKWANGNKKARIWVFGSFPIPPGVSERPTWFVNGRNVGHATVFFGDRTLPNTSHMLNDGENTIEVKFLKPPYNGASFKKTISNFSWDNVPNGGYKSFN